ncbi:GGDEF domain-containing protein [Vibrio sp. ZSDZ34]|uniref:diguanylate cyclase n=1 Tax=Vibrio gelatinilyticus TaxID=2893468 RepID=A0A9X1WCZ1_9VIBR|nr:GGDEF domain-containing protein [Vibrio gelatinilyticus]MCJ2376868.1 GGDEF domain-containing protein [Vibrio gelatinilyticus]
MSWIVIFNKDNRYILLAIISLSILSWHKWGMNIEQSFTLDHSNVSMVNDTINGGRSLGRIVPNTSTVSFTCKTVRSNTFQFCSVMIPITSHENQGVDLSSLSHLEVTLSYTEVAGIRDSVLVYLHNQETSSSGESISRTNLKTIVPSNSDKNTYSIDLKALHVPSWWLLNNPNVADIAAKINNITHIQVATGDSHRLKNTNIEIHQLKIKGKWINLETIQACLFTLWSTVILIDILMRIVKSHRSAQNSILVAHKERDKYQRLAVRDPLTGISNRQGVHEYFQSSRQTSKAMFIILFDVDHFKKVNDVYGHNEGDNILVNLSATVGNNLANGTCFARWGGEEFIILCHEQSRHTAVMLAEQIRLTIAAAKLSQYTKVTCSVGITDIDYSLPLTLNVERADKALYKAKSSGRNQVCSYLKLDEPKDDFPLDSTA